MAAGHSVYCRRDNLRHPSEAQTDISAHPPEFKSIFFIHSLNALISVIYSSANFAPLQVTEIKMPGGQLLPVRNFLTGQC